MVKANSDIRKACKENRIYLWQVADNYKGGMADSNFAKLLRHELPEVEKHEIYSIIDCLKGDVSA